MPLATSELIIMSLSFGGMLACIGVAVYLFKRQNASGDAAVSRRARDVTPLPEAERTTFVEPPAPDRTEFFPAPEQPEKTELFLAPSPPEKTEFIPAVAASHAARTTATPAERGPTAADSAPAFAPLPKQGHSGLGPRPLSGTTSLSSFMDLAPGVGPSLSPKLESEDAESTAVVPIANTAPAQVRAEDLAEHLRLAVDAFANAQSDAFAGHVAVLAAKPAEAVLEHVRPRLQAAVDLRWSAALLVLLHNKAWPAKTALPELIATLDPERQDAASRTLQSWDDRRAKSLAAACLKGASSPKLRALWLRCFAERGWEPELASIDAALRDGDPELLTAGLRLLPREATSKLSSSMFAGDARVRMQAVETALVHGSQSAWLMCRQLARKPMFARAAELVGLLGSAVEINEFSDALDGECAASLLRGLGLSGRPSVLLACVRRFDDHDAERKQAARNTLALAAGQTFADVAAAEAWLTPRMNAERLLAGGPRSGQRVLEVLVSADQATRESLARELLVRSGGRLRLPAWLLPAAFTRELERLRQEIAAVAFEREFPWT